MTRYLVRTAVVLAVTIAGYALGSTTATAAELDDFLWTSRPLLVFAPTDDDSRLIDTGNRIEATRCEFDERDMVLGVVVAEGTSTLDGEVLDADEARRLMARYAIDENSFTALLIGKDGGEKLRVDGVPDLGTLYTVIDGMPMRGGEMDADPGRC